VASIADCVCFGVPPQERRNMNYSSKRTLNFLETWKEWKRNQRDVTASLRDNAMKKTAAYKWVKRLFEGRDKLLTKRDRDGQQQAELKKTL
jgi:hypothetical protein